MINGARLFKGLLFIFLQSSFLLGFDVPIALSLAHLEGRGIGFQDGYTSLSSFYLPASNVPFFLNGRFHVFNSQNTAGNFGLGTRLTRASHQIGMNAYYDYRQFAHYTFSQLGLGMEWLGPCAELHANGYFSVGPARHLVHKCVFDQYVGGYIIIEKIYENALPGADLEIGAHLFQDRCVCLYGGVGGYYYKGPCREIWGGFGRLTAKFRDFIKLEFFVSDDPVFKTRYSGRVFINLNLLSNRTLADLFCRPILRREIIPIEHNCDWYWNY
jgi:hypothetical protein